VYNADNNTPIHGGVKGDGAKGASNLDQHNVDKGFYVDGVIGTNHKFVSFANGAPSGTFSHGCSNNMDSAYAGTHAGSFKRKNYGTAAVQHYYDECSTHPRSLWIDKGKIWGNEGGGENDENCDTNCGNGGGFGGQPNGRSDEMRFWTL
jgi:hypothetical protein